MSLSRYHTGALRDYKKASRWERSGRREEDPGKRPDPKSLPRNTLGGDLIDESKIPQDLPEDEGQ